MLFFVLISLDAFKSQLEQGMVVHAYNPSYLGGKDQDCGSTPTSAKCLQNTTSTNGWTQWHTPVIPGMG
jgi:hypothetical protein